MFILQLLILIQWIKVPELRNASFEGQLTLIAAAFSTILSIILTVYQIWAESKGLRENSMDYILLSMKAK